MISVSEKSKEAWLDSLHGGLTRLKSIVPAKIVVFTQVLLSTSKVTGCWQNSCLLMLSMLSSLLSNKQQKISVSNTFNQGISGGPSGKESTCQCRICRKYRLQSWVGKIPWRKKWQGSPVFSTIKSHGQRSLLGYSPWGRKESDMTKQLSDNKNNFNPHSILGW